MADNEAKIDLGIAGLGPAEHIGRGGFADVYRAEQISLRRTVAVKVLRAQASDPEAEARFERECHAIGAVSDHPHIVGVHEGGFTRNGRAYLVMEYLPGGSLYERLAEHGPMSVSEVVDTGIKIGKALAVAHRTGVLHRDIKPANIMISAYGEPALGDFGIARIEGGHQTATGLVTASFAHAAPEVLEGNAPSAGADIYSLGTTIFELLTGRPPYFDSDDESIWPLMKRILSEPMPSPESVGMSPRLGAIFTRATARNVGERYGDAEEFVEDLTVVASDPLSVTLYPPSGDGSAGPTGKIDGPGRLPDTKAGGAARTLVGGLPLDGTPAPVTRPDLTSVHRGETRVMPTHQLDEPAIRALQAPRDEPQLSNGPAATTMDLPASVAAARPAGGSGSRITLAIGAGVVLLVAVVVGALYLLGGRGSVDGGQPGGTSALDAVIRDGSDVAVDGPLTVGAGYAVAVVDAPPGSQFRLVLDGEPVGEPSGAPPRFEAGSGRHAVAVELTTPSGSEVTDPVAVYGIDWPPAAGYRANLASIHVQRQGWAAAMEVFDRLVNEGHTDLEVLATDDFAVLTPGYWNLSVPGFGDDPAAAEAYCERFGLAIPTDCYAGYLAPEAP